MNQNNISITIHNLDPEVYQAINTRAKNESLSLNKTIKKWLATVVGKQKTAQKNDFSEFFGVWKQDQFQEFQKNSTHFDQVDQEEWK